MPRARTLCEVRRILERGVVKKKDKKEEDLLAEGHPIALGVSRDVTK